ncbi:MAG: DUF2330 domain-containing protein, partial [Planctomycetales bacterium]
IPFPNPPALRKVPDNVFQHVAAAIDPPEVTVDLSPPPPQASFFRSAPSAGARTLTVKSAAKPMVRVIKKEAVGMYEVVVLEAGSAAALKMWMDDHGYKYPQGMDAVCEEYVKAGWCFTAIKTKVGQKDRVNPRPGQRRVNSNLPSGSAFDGHVQGMGFRFKSDELVVPMRLSAFNDGELRNIVYLVTDGPKRIRSIPEEYVVRQVAGKQLGKNLIEPLPLRILGGTEDDLLKRIKENGYLRLTVPRGGKNDRSLKPAERLKVARDPAPHVASAKALFASDLQAISGGRLSLPHEEQEKELLRVGERFGLRGPTVDRLNGEVLKEQSAKTVGAALGDLSGLTLTVVDGDFPREVLAGKNLTFATYNMPDKRNTSGAYDAKLKRPSPQRSGVLKLGWLELDSEEEKTEVAATGWVGSWLPLVLFLTGILGLTVVRRRLR